MGDRMEITLLSKHNKDEMYEVDYFGRTKIIPIPIENNEEKERLVALARTEGKDEERDLNLEEGDEEVDEAKEKAVYAIGAIPMPSKLKMVVKIGYTEGLIWQMKNEAREQKREPQTWDSYIEEIMTHVQARYYDPTLGTLVQWEVQPGFLYANETWCAEHDLWYAKQETIKAKLKDVAVTAWITTNNSTTCKHGGWVGMSYLNSLCTRGSVNINEKHSSVANVAYTVAHETGHNMGMDHDFASSHGGKDNPCNSRKPIGTRGTMGYSYSATGWSQCSRYDFEHSYAEEFWGNGCLEDISRPCTKFTCENGGTCTETENGGFSCTCPSGVTGTHCENNPKRHSNGHNSGCTSKNKCIEGDGDCDRDSDCVEGLICGSDNCPRKYGYDWQITDDCCFKPEYYDETNSTTCESTDGTCIFPFYYGGVKFENCANPTKYKQNGKEVGWCAFDTVYKSRRWGYCTDECLKTHDGRCEATSLEWQCRPIVSGTARKGAGYNGTCTFPFKYDNRIYNTCADPKDYGGLGWCAFDFDKSGREKNGRWGYCTSKCPQKVEKACEGVVCNVPDEQCKNGVCTPGYDRACEGIVCNVANEKCVNGICKCGDACSCEGNPKGNICDAANSKCKCYETGDECVDGNQCDPWEQKCKRCIGDSSCCTKDKKCGVNEGHCRYDTECEQGLKCGDNNCVGEPIGLWLVGTNCCYDPVNGKCEGGDSCCTDEYPCGVGEGDCDRDSNCEGGLKWGLIIAKNALEKI